MAEGQKTNDNNGKAAEKKDPVAQRMAPKLKEVMGVRQQRS